MGAPVPGDGSVPESISGATVVRLPLDNAVETDHNQAQNLSQENQLQTNDNLSKYKRALVLLLMALFGLLEFYSTIRGKTRYVITIIILAILLVFSVPISIL